MIIVSGTIEMSAQDLGIIHNAAIAMVEATRLEEGCIEYEFSEVIGEPGKMRVWERWETSDALDAHAASEHMAVWRAATAEITITTRDLSKYEGVDTIMPI